MVLLKTKNIYIEKNKTLHILEIWECETIVKNKK